jgi:hypothetical protein
MDQSSFAAPHGLSQRITSFIACACQGIHQLPLRHLIVLIVYAHHLLDLEFLSLRLRSGGSKSDHTDKPHSSDPKAGLPFTTRTHSMMPSTCSIDRFIGATPSSSLAACLKTSFSRYDPIPRGQATVIRSFIRRCPKATNNKRSRVTSFLPTSNPSTTSGRLGHPWFHRNWARTSRVKPKTPGSLQINLLFTMYAEHASAISRCKTLFSSKDKRRQLQHQSIWWS